MVVYPLSGLRLSHSDFLKLQQLVTVEVDCTGIARESSDKSIVSIDTLSMFAERVRKLLLFC